MDKYSPPANLPCMPSKSEQALMDLYSDVRDEVAALKDSITILGYLLDQVIHERSVES